MQIVVIKKLNTILLGKSLVLKSIIPSRIAKNEELIRIR